MTDGDRTHIRRRLERIATVTSGTLDRLRTAVEITLGEYRTLVDVTIVCEDCDTKADVADRLDRRGCGCGPTADRSPPVQKRSVHLDDFGGTRISIHAENISIEIELEVARW